MPRRVGQRVCHYEYDHWYDESDGRLYVKTTGIEYERATEDAFLTACSRRLRDLLRRDGYLGEKQRLRFTIGLEEWDRSHNIADGLLETVTYRTVNPVLERVAA